LIGICDYIIYITKANKLLLLRLPFRRSSFVSRFIRQRFLDFIADMAVEKASLNVI